ncbi:MAG: FGGY-family carbohydrate kinase [Dehalococcoidales bacterium]
MSASYVLAIDAGTSGVHCLLTDFTGHPISQCYREWCYQSPEDVGSLGREFSPVSFWGIICDSVKEVVTKAGIHTQEIAGVSATSQRQGAVFLDKNGGELYAGPNIDLRALTEGSLLDSKFGKEVYAITGHLPSFLFVSAKLKWFEANRPDTYSKIATILTISDWIIYRLCGEYVSEVCGATELGLVDVQRRDWSKRLRKLLDLPDGIYPQLVPAGSQVGRITREAAAETGLVPGTPIVQAAPDTHCALIGMGVTRKGQVGIVIGWSAPVQMVTDSPILDPGARTWTGCYPLPDRWVLESSAGDAGNAYLWLKGILFSEGNSAEAYRLMDSLAAEAPAGAAEVRAFVGPATMDMSHLTMKLGGFLFPVPAGVTDVRRGHLVRAVLENLCFALKANCAQLEAISGLKIEAVSIGGSLAKSRCLAQILPNVLGIPVSVPEITEVSALGAAICAAVGSGAYSSLEEGVKAMVPQFRIVEPDGLTSLEYAEYYERWTATAEWLRKLGEAVR